MDGPYTPVQPGDLDTTLSTPDLTSTVTDTLGDLGTVNDEFDPILADVATHHQQNGDLITAIERCWGSLAAPAGDLATPFEQPLVYELGSLLDDGDAVLAGFDDTLSGLP